MKYILITTFLISNFAYSQMYSSQVFNYDDNITFQITRLKGSADRGIGYTPLRGYTSYTFYLKFTNNSDQPVEGNLKDIYLANPKTKRKYDLKWFNTAGIGSKMKPTFELKPNKSKKFILNYVYEINQRIYFLINDKLTLIKAKNEI
ncbi:hypothetical protein [[Muricauda] lutisoli]|uniref:DUF4352 domain-containing protein n=1 Tax=[Muricauda] lutisoli TaxID=2816035 RepID=A0ABS3EUC1_9FLAO|nr:hypothetical protein [[Muricauda] lutisoli]MBO0329842.1 hypothetical protein [[Muricauda] lutisoli]